MALSTTPELLRELAMLYRRVAELERAGGLRPGEGAPEGVQRNIGDLGAGLHAVIAAFSDDLLGVLTPAGDILYVNEAVERLTGFRADEVIGKNAWSFVSEEDLASLASARSTPLDDAIPIEVRIRCADGRLRWVEFSARPWPRENPIHIVARWRDAQARRDPGASRGDDAARLDAELRRAAALARVSQLALGLPSVQDVLDAAASLAASALGLSAGAYLEPEGGAFAVRAAAGIPVSRGHAVPLVMTLAGLARAGSAPAHSADVVRDGRLADSLLAAAGASAALAVPVRGKERGHGVLLVAGRTPRHFTQDEIHFLETVANVVATSVDARAAQEALRGRERLARAVFDHARDGLAIVDRDGRCLDANAAAERILGTTFEALRGHRPSDVVRTDLDLAPRTPRQGEGTVTTASDTRVVEWDVVPDIQPGVALAMLRDATARREVATRLALADRLISVGSLAAGVAHELNTPLAYVAANLEYLAAAVPPLVAEGAGAEVREALQESVEGVERLGVILQDLRTFVSHTSGEEGPADLEAVLRSSVAMTWNEIRHRARLERDVRRVPPVQGSPARLAQVFVNLLANAAQAIPEGDAQSHVIRISAREQPGGRVAVEVADTGVGISPAALPRVFEPFFTTKPAGQGTGLGLSICRSIVHGLGGSLEVKSTPGSGATFRVILPAATEPKASAGARPLARAAASIVPRSRVLVVDDERLVASSLRRALAADHDVTVVSSARAALRLVERGERYDVVLTDLVMPDVTGLELHRQLVALVPELDGRVLFMTAGAFTQEARLATEIAADACLEKPVRLDVLRAALARVIAARPR